MGYKEMQIDVGSLGTEALRERQPAEQLDEALLRAAKERYGDSGSIVFQAIKAAVGAVAKRNKMSADEALQQMIDGRRSIKLVTRTQTVGSEDEVDNLDIKKGLAALDPQVF